MIVLIPLGYASNRLSNENSDNQEKHHKVNDFKAAAKHKSHTSDS